MNGSFWHGFLFFPVVAAAAILVLLYVARCYRAVVRWYIGLPITRWWAMGLLVLALKNIPQKNVKVIRAQGRIWISPLVKEYVDKNTIT